MEDAQLRAYMQQILAPTFVLDDGSMLKIIPVDWTELRQGQMQIVLAAIKAMIIDELKRLKPGSRLRLEFNEIPEEVEELLLDLAGSDASDLEWARFETG